MSVKQADPEWVKSHKHRGPFYYFMFFLHAFEMFHNTSLYNL